MLFFILDISNHFFFSGNTTPIKCIKKLESINENLDLQFSKKSGTLFNNETKIKGHLTS
ncbi:hypothetical protein GCM10007940_40250 [Portibacter lacus]|uniref:Uncharacterized protein n=1 Tax=Portibacter lacus TaxID=1099794 RepID=A0AA37WHI8_9BACT|nr:hypothetical protein GCM10007940_40250 [Portibacter lacus]